MPVTGAGEPDLDFWLQHIASVHPREIELGLDRVREVSRRLGLGRPARYVVVVAGTNGKGSCIAAMEALLLAAGHETVSYTSPHIRRINERIRCGGREVADRDLCEALQAVESARGDISLSYFEFVTLAALRLFNRVESDVALLEVGLGGRLDAVNIIDADITAITSISLDHQDWLGSDLDGIAAEKAGIMRPGIPVVCGESVPNSAIVQKSRELAARLYLPGQDFDWQETDGECWSWRGLDAQNQAIERPGLPRSALATVNLAVSLQVLALLPLALPSDTVREALTGLKLAGRLESRVDRSGGGSVLLDVAHNPASAALLARRLQQFRQRQPESPRIALVLAVMADKDIEGIWSALESCVDICYIAQVDEPRCMPASEAVGRVRRSDSENAVALRQSESVEQAYRAACTEMGADGLVVVTGSFLAVAAIRDLTEDA